MNYRLWFGVLLCAITTCVYAAEGEENFILAVKWNNCAAFDEYMASGVNIQCKDGEGNTPLHLACKNRDLYMVERLLAGKAEVNVCADNGYTPLHYVVSWMGVHPEEKEATLIRLLKRAGADVNARVKVTGSTPLHMVVGREYIEDFVSLNGKLIPVTVYTPPAKEEVVLALIGCGADARVRNVADKSVMQVASENGASAEVMSFLKQLSYYKSLQKLIRNKYSLREDQSRKALDAMHMLASKAAGLIRWFFDEHGRTLAHEVALYGDQSTVLQLRWALAPLMQQRDLSGCTPLMLAQKVNNQSAAIWLNVKPGAKIQLYQEKVYVPVQKRILKKDKDKGF